MGKYKIREDLKCLNVYIARKKYPKVEMCPSCYNELTGGKKEMNYKELKLTHWIEKSFTGKRRGFLNIKKNFTIVFYICANCGHISQTGLENICPNCNKHMGNIIKENK